MKPYTQSIYSCSLIQQLIDCLPCARCAFKVLGRKMPGFSFVSFFRLPRKVVCLGGQQLSLGLASLAFSPFGKVLDISVALVSTEQGGP